MILKVTKMTRMLASDGEIEPSIDLAKRRRRQA
jgi:hypothetical protein